MVYVLPRGYSPEKKWPLLVVLHGSGDRAEGFIRIWQVEQTRGRFILVAVNSQDRGSWNYFGDQKAIFEAIDHLKSKFSVDPRNIWLGGFSAGGFMTSGTALGKPVAFRGMIVCGAGAGRAAPSDLSSAANVASYVLIGDRDPNLNSSRALHESLKKVPLRELKYDEIKGQGHTITAANIQSIMNWVCPIVDRVEAPPTQIKVTITVGVKDNVARGELDALSKKIQEASDQLFRLTGGQMFFDRVKISDASSSGDLRIENDAKIECVSRKFIRASPSAEPRDLLQELCRLKFGVDGAEFGALQKKYPRLKTPSSDAGAPPHVKFDITDTK